MYLPGSAVMQLIQGDLFKDFPSLRFVIPRNSRANTLLFKVLITLGELLAAVLKAKQRFYDYRTNVDAYPKRQTWMQKTQPSRNARTCHALWRRRCDCRTRGVCRCIATSKVLLARDWSLHAAVVDLHPSIFVAK